MCTIVAELAELASPSQMGPAFKLLLTSADKSTAVLAIIPQSQQVALRTGHVDHRPVSQALRHDLASQSQEDLQALPSQHQLPWLQPQSASGHFQALPGQSSMPWLLPAPEPSASFYAPFNIPQGQRVQTIYRDSPEPVLQPRYSEEPMQYAEHQGPWNPPDGSSRY